MPDFCGKHGIASEVDAVRIREINEANAQREPDVQRELRAVPEMP
jgi:hypothetical protein